MFHCGANCSFSKDLSGVKYNNRNSFTGPHYMTEPLSSVPSDVVLEGKRSFSLASSAGFMMCAFVLVLLCELLPAQADVRDGFSRTAAKSQLSFQGP